MFRTTANVFSNYFLLLFKGSADQKMSLMKFESSDGRELGDRAHAKPIKTT